MEKFKNLKFAIAAMLMMVSSMAFAQVTVTGTVVDEYAEPVLGATVREVGTTNGGVTDIDGNFVIKVSSAQATLVVTYVGYLEQEVKLAGRTSGVAIQLQQDALMLDETVVVGYGVQKKKLVTGATVEVKGEAIQKLNTTQVLGALQSQTPGVNITAQSGQPGDGFKVAIRGAGTNSDTKPIYVIDGVAGGDINNLNPADIERIDVLKDAASAAIYGANGANGVIIITTKQGKEGKVQISYDGNIGWQNVYKMPQLLNAQQYMQIQDVVNFNSSGTTYDWSKFLTSDLLESYLDGSNTGTNWLDVMKNNNAVTTSHSLNVAGGNDRSKFSMGVGYQYQDGIFGGEAKSDYRRFTLRLNSDHVVLRNSKGMDVIKVGENLYMQQKENQGIQIGNQYSNVISTALRANPLIPAYGSIVDGAYVNDGSYFDYDDLSAMGMFGFNSYSSNPLYSLMSSQSANNKSQNYSLSAVGFVEIQPIKGLVYRAQFNYSQSSYSWRCYLPTYRINDQGESRNNEQVTQQLGMGWGWGTTHTVNYKFDVDKQHHFDVLAGTEYGCSKPDYGQSLSATVSGATMFGTMYQAYVGLVPSEYKTSSATVDGYPYTDSRSMSYFGRVNYDFNETYMFSAVIRADGSSNFADGHRWGYFPSVSAGWVVTNEKWMENSSSWLDFLKIRAGWGQNGNKNVGDDFAYLATFAYDAYSNYSFNNTKTTYTSGASPTRLANDDLTWETSEQTDLGFDMRLLNGRFGITFDWYYKKTKDLLLSVPTYATSGFSTYWSNAGSVRNTGIELALDWHDKIGKDLSYNVGWNMAYTSNMVTEITGADYIEGGNDLLAQSTGIIARMEAGHPIGYFYGFKTDGVIQNEADLQAYLAANCGGDAANSAQGSSIAPGDLKFVDVNGDGVITDDDKTEIGSPHPDVTMGINIGLNWKGFDLNITGYAALGQEVARSYRKFTDGQYENYTTEVYSYWNGEGTSNRYPKLQPGNRGVNWQYISDIYVEDASYFRLQNLTLGYDLNRLFKAANVKSPFEQLRVYVAAQNLFTITGYDGMDPECGTALNSDEPWVTGVDVGNYPSARTYMIGVNVKF